jgi:hypothetical protein
MKRLSELTIDDLRSHTVWLFSSTGEGDLNAGVQAVPLNAIAEANPDVFLVATRFWLRDGSEWLGFCSPQDSSGLDYVQPVIVTSDGHVQLWFEQMPSLDKLEAWWRRLNKPKGTVFPIQFECLVPVDGKVIRGEIKEGDVFGSAT